MKIINENMWESLPYEDFRTRFFIETFYELVHKVTPHFHQSRLLNVIAASQEVLSSIEDYKLDNKNIRNLYNSIFELKSSLQIDFVMKDMIKLYQPNLTALFQSLNNQSKNKEDQEDKKRNNIDYTILRELSLICKSILTFEQKYITTLTDKIIYETTSPDVELSKIGIITNNIYTLTSLYLTNLLSRNFSQKYINNQIQYLMNRNNYKTKSFNDMFQNMFNKFNNKIQPFTISFAMHSNDKEQLLRYESNAIEIKLDVTDTFSENEIKKITEGLNSQNVFAILKIDTTDYISAAFQAKEKIDLMTDLLSFNNTLQNKDISKTCLVKVQETQGSNHVFHVHMNKLSNSVTTTFTRRYSKYDKVLQKLTNRFDTESCNKFYNSLHYMRLSKDTNNIEQKLLNLWICLESLFDKNGQTIIGSIITWLPKVYAVTSVLDRVTYIFTLLKKYNIAIPSDIVVAYNLQTKDTFNKISLEEFSKVFFNEKDIEKVFESLNKKEFLKFRILSTFNELKTHKKIISRIDKTTLDIERQLKRIYVIRNKSMHRAFHGHIKGQIVNHLHEYTMMCFHAILSTLNKTDLKRQVSLDDALLAYQLGVENLYNQIDSKEENTVVTFDDLIIQPII